MLMVRDEWGNIRKLLKLKIQSSSAVFITFFLVAALMFSINVIPAAANILRDGVNGVTPYKIADYSNTFFWYIALFCLIVMLAYRDKNDCLSVFPQTNMSRFISTELLNYIFATVAGLTSLVLYLLQYAIFKLISLFIRNIYFVLDFDIGFIIAGALTFLVYSFLIVALFGLVGAILRKWHFYAVIVFISVTSILISNMAGVVKYAPKVFAFLVSEPSFFWFIIKGIILWLVIAAASIALNSRTAYYKSRKKIAGKGIVIIGIIFVFTIILATIFILSNAGNAQWQNYTELTAIPEEEYYAQYSEIRIDISHLPRGSKLNYDERDLLIRWLNNSMNFNIFPSGTDVLDDVQSDTLLILYKPPEYQWNGYELHQYCNANLTARLDGNTLRFEYTYENAHVLFTPVWGMFRQFDYCKDRNVLPSLPWGYSSSGGGNGSILFKME